MDYTRIYEYRFKNVDKQKKLIAWKIIAGFIRRKLDNPASIIDPAAGECEFINAFPAPEKWAVDLNREFITTHAGKDIEIRVGNSLNIELPANHFDAVFISNFLEHLDSHDEINLLLKNMHKCLKKGGKIAVMGPNFKYCPRAYFDFADHKMILTNLSMEEHLYCAGFNVTKAIPRFLPVSFRGKYPVSKFLLNLYLAVPLLWKIFGKQFLIIAEK